MGSAIQPDSGTATPSENPTDFKRSLGLYDSTMIVAGSMIGSGIFIVSAAMARELGSSGWLLVSWIIAGVLTITAALSYGELASMMPKAGGQYVYLRESYSPAVGFLYGWTLFLIIQTGTVAAVAVGFARYLGVLWPTVSESKYLFPPIHIGSRYAFSLSTAQLVAVLVILFLTWTNSQGLKYGKLVQNVFTVCKIGALLGLILVGLVFGANSHVIAENFKSMWSPSGVTPISAGLGATGVFGILIAIGISQTGSLFAADAWNNITFTAGEVRNPKRNIPLSLALGTGLVIGLYLLVNLGFLFSLRFDEIQHVASDRVATATLHTVFPGLGEILMAIAIMVSTFGCINGMLLAGSRAYYAMAKDRLFFNSAGGLNRAGVPGNSLLLQGIWASLLVLPRTFDTATHTYGNLYSNLLDYVVSAVLIFYILTIFGVFRLRRIHPSWERPYRTFGYPIVPALYILGATAILIILFCYRPATTMPGLAIIALGVPVYLALRYKASRG